VEASRPVPQRWEGHGAERVREEHLPSVGVAYCDVGWADDGDGSEAEQTAGLAAEGIAGGSIPGQDVRVRRFPLLVRTD
jgi:hypothetical protein